MSKKGILLVLAACLAASMACQGADLFSPAPTFTPTTTPTETQTPTVTLTVTLTPYPTRTASPTLIPGIEEPMKVGDANLLIVEAVRRDSFRCGEDNAPAENPESEEIFVLVLKVIKGPTYNSDAVGKWIEDNDIKLIKLGSETRNGRESTDKYWHMCIASDNTKKLAQLMIAYVIDQDAEKFRVILPDKTEIPLDSFFP
jgi:hypothetical protein